MRAGQALYEIDPAPYRATLDQAQATVESAEANVVSTRLKSDRFGTLATDNAVSKQDRDDARAAARQAVALLRQNAATRRSAAINLGYTTIPRRPAAASAVPPSPRARWSAPPRRTR